MKLTRLKVHRYRGVAPGAELVFSPSLNVVLGENGTGRTALLELISAALGSDFSGLLREEFSVEYSLALPDMELHVAVSNEQRSGAAQPEGAVQARDALLPPVSSEVVLDFEPRMEVVLQLAAPASRLVMRADSGGVSWVVDGKPSYSQSMSWSLLDRSVWVVLFMTAQYLEPEVKERLKELLHRTFLLAPARFDEALGMFEQIGRIRYVMEMRGSDVFPLGLMALPTWLPGWLRERVERQPPADIIELGHTEVAQGFLERFVALSGFAAGKFRLELVRKREYESGGRLEFGNFGFRFTRGDGSELSAEQLGYGQRRLLSFLYYLDVNEDFVIADELPNGLQPRWVEACVRELGERQTFLTSQNPLLYEHVRLESAAQVRASLIVCREGRTEGRQQRVWSHPTAEEAEGLWASSRGGATTLAELLRAHRPW